MPGSHIPDTPRPATSHTLAAWSAVLLTVLVLGGLYAATLQTHISGSFPESTPESVLKNEYIKDVSEIQVALNVWGTIHHTGYPLFAILGNLFTPVLRATGIAPAAAASLYATAWGVLMLAGLGLLIWRLTGRPALAAASVILLGAARSIWIHHVIAEVYSMSLALTMIMLLVAVWPSRMAIQRRVLWLAFLGGMGVAHHRAIVFIAPGLILAVWPELRRARPRWGRLIVAGAALALLGFIPYVYLPLREYGEPGTLRGFWIEFSGKEADRLVKLPASMSELWDNITHVWDILGNELTSPGRAIALVCLLGAVTVAPRRRAARIVAVSAAGPTIFAVFYHTAVLPQAILMPAILALVVGVALALDGVMTAWRRIAPLAPIALIAWAGALVVYHYDYVRELVSEPTGQHLIERLDQLPREGKPALMLPWGPRYAAASYARLVTREYADVVMVDHKGDYRGLLAAAGDVLHLPAPLAERVWRTFRVVAHPPRSVGGVVRRTGLRPPIQYSRAGRSRRLVGRATGLWHHPAGCLAPGSPVMPRTFTCM